MTDSVFEDFSLNINKDIEKEIEENFNREYNKEGYKEEMFFDSKESLTLYKESKHEMYDVCIHFYSRLIETAQKLARIS